MNRASTCALCICLVACRSKSSSQSSSMTEDASAAASRPLTSGAPGATDASHATTEEDVHVYSGTAGAQTSVRLYVARHGDALDGVIRLEELGPALTLRGKATDPSHYHLEERGPRGVALQRIDLSLDDQGGATGTLTSAAPASDGKPGKETKQPLALRPNGPFGGAKPSFTQAYVGSIGGHLRVRGKLERSEGKITGVYRYTRSKSDLALAGTVDPKTGELTLSEMAGQKITGNMHGFFLDQNLLVGTWSSADGKKSLALRLERADEYPVAVPLLGGGRAVPQEAYAEPAPSCTSSVIFPMLDGLPSKDAQTRVNAFLRHEATTMRLAADDCQGASPEMPYDIEATYSVQPKNGFLGVDLSGWGFTGGAHGSTWEQCLVFDLAKGENVPLLPLFTADGRKRLDAMVEEKLKKQFGTSNLADLGFFEEHPSVGDHTNLCLREKGLDVAFSDYEIAPHVIGPQNVPFSAAEVRPLLTPSPIVDAILAK